LKKNYKVYLILVKISPGNQLEIITPCSINRTKLTEEKEGDGCCVVCL